MEMWRTGREYQGQGRQGRMTGDNRSRTGEEGQGRDDKGGERSGENRRAWRRTSMGVNMYQINGNIHNTFTLLIL